jgi:hypothetical protein
MHSQINSTVGKNQWEQKKQKRIFEVFFEQEKNKCRAGHRTRSVRREKTKSATVFNYPDKTLDFRVVTGP